MTFTIKQKNAALDKIKGQENKSLEEQDVYREMMEKYKGGEEKVIHNKITELGLNGIKVSLSSELFPPCHQEREEILGIKYNEAVAYKRIKSIEDFDISAALYFYNELADHTQRLRAMAKFMELLGGLTCTSELIMNFWVTGLMHRELLKEAEVLGLVDKIKGLTEVIEAYDTTCKIFIDGCSRDS